MLALKNTKIVIALFSLYFLLPSLVMAQPVIQSIATNTGSGNPVSVNAPAGVAEGDLLVIGIVFDAGDNVGITAAGWTSILRTYESNNLGMATFYKVAGPSEPMDYSFSLTPNSQWAIGISRISNVSIYDPVNNFVGAFSSASSTSVVAPSVNTFLNNSLVLAFFSNASNSTFTGVSTEQYDSPNAGVSNMMASYTLASSGSTGTKTATSTVSSTWVAQQIVIAPNSPFEALFTTSGSHNFIKPDGVTQINVRCWGGGGGAEGGTGDAKSGGGGGAFANSILTVPSAETSYSLFVGAGGMEGANGGNSTFFGDNLDVVADGGKAGQASAGGLGGTAAASTGNLKYGGGNGSLKTNSEGGAGGGSAFTNSDGGSATGTVGGIGKGNGGDGGISNNLGGGNGFWPGGGAGGKSSGNGSNGVGGNGLVYISWGPALPVTWLNFRAALTEDNDVNLYWSTASESNNEGFDIQRSENGRDWETIDFVEGAGTTSEVQNYAYTDASLSTLNTQLSTVYYRLMQKDFDGTTDYSPVRVVELDNAGGIRVFPNPASEQVTIAFAEAIETRGIAQLFTQNNRLVYEYPIAPGTSEYQFRVNALPSGTYVLKVKVGTKEWMKRLVVE